MSPVNGVDQKLLDEMNVEQSRVENKARLDDVGGIKTFCSLIGVNPTTGLTSEQVTALRAKFGENRFPESPMTPFYRMFLDALNDPTLLLLLAAATVSLIIGMATGHGDSWIEAAAIYFAVILVATISAGNDYSKQLQFRALEATSAQDERTSVLRNGVKERINPIDIVVGDIVVLQVSTGNLSSFAMFYVLINLFHFVLLSGW